MPTARSATTDDGVEIAFDDVGRGRPVVWLHGITDDMASWEPITSRLSGEMRCIRIDFRGHGHSQGQGPYSTGLLLDVAAVIRDTGITSPVVVGHSLGGVVATLAAASGLTGPVVCVDQPLKLGSVAPLIRSVASRVKDPATYADTLVAVKLDLGAALVPRRDRAAIERATRNSTQEATLELWQPLLEADAAAMAETEETLQAALRSIDVPYLALHSQRPGPDYEKWFRATNRQATLECWPDLGHWLHLVQPARFAERIRQFVEHSESP